MKKRKNQKTNQEMVSDVIFLHSFPEVIYEKETHPGLINLLFMAEHLFPHFIGGMFEQANVKSPYRFKDFEVEYLHNCECMALLIEINNKQCSRFKRIYVLFKEPFGVVKTIENPSYYLVLEEPDHSSTMVYINEALDITELHENLQEEMELDLIAQHYSEMFG